MNSVTKVISFEQALYEEASIPRIHKASTNRLIVHGIDCIDIIRFSDILYLVGEGNYCQIVKKSGEKILSSKTLKYFEEQLPRNMFLRPHKSYVVNIHHISKVYKRPNMELELNGQVRIPTSRSKKSLIFKLFQA